MISTENQKINKKQLKSDKEKTNDIKTNSHQIK